MKKIVVILTACLLLLGLGISAAAQATPRAVQDSMDDLTYTDDPKNASTIPMYEVLSQIENFTVSDAEKNYIRYRFSGQKELLYEKPTSVIDPSYEYDGVNKTLTIEVQDDYYAFRNGTELTWTPTTASYGSATATFTDIGDYRYRAVIEDVEWAESMTLSIEYCADFEFDADTLNAFVNFAYDRAVQLEDEMATFEIEEGLYQTALRAYEENAQAWKQYDADVVQYGLYQDRVKKYADVLLYRQYLADMDAYTQAHNAYLANQRDWEKYYADCKKYEQYLNYKNNEYPALNKDYQNKMNTVQHQLDLLALLEKVDPNTGYSFIETMMDDRIGEMISNNYDRVVIAVGPGTTNAIIESTGALKRFCSTYISLKTDQEKYLFYIKEYENFCIQLDSLYNNIHKLYNTNSIYKELKDDYPDRIETMVRMMGSLYVQSCVFNDRVTLNLNTEVDSRGHQKAYQLVDASVRPASDTNKATPLATWPVAPTSPESYEVTSQPVAPAQKLQDGTYPSMPVFSTVQHAGQLDLSMQDPGYMAEPVEPTQRLSHPGVAPTLNWDPIIEELYQAYEDGLLVERPEFDDSYTYTMSTSLNYAFNLSGNERVYFVYFYNTDAQGTYLGHSTGVVHGQAAKVPANIQPTKQPDAQKYYEFAGWVDKSGNPADLTCITSDLNVYASYREVIRSYQVTWNVEGTLHTEQYLYGETPVFKGSLDKASDAQYDYEFVSWDKTVIPVTGDTTYTAKYSAIEKCYKVTFDMGDGTFIEREYAYGQSIADVVSTLPVPYLQPNAEFTYSFKGWTDENGVLYTDPNGLPALTRDMRFTAQFFKTVNTYTVTWIVDGVVTTTTWSYGDTPAYGEGLGAEPFKEMDERYHYFFAGWDTEIVKVTGDATYTAQFTSEKRLYRVDFIVEGVEYTLELEYEQIPVFEGIPQKESDVQYDYTFLGWDTEPVPVRQDAIYIAEFGKVVRKYPVKFVVGGNEITLEFEYGKKPVYPYDTPTKADDNEYCYVFAGWDKELAAVDGSAVTYTACFSAMALAPVPGGNNGQIVSNANGNYQLKLEGDQADLSLVFNKLGKEQAAQLEVFFGDAVLNFPKSQIDMFYLMGDGIANVQLAKTIYQGRAAYKLEMTDKSGTAVQYLVSELTVKLPYSGAYAADVFVVESDGTLTKVQTKCADGYLEFSTMNISTFVIMDKYQIQQTPAENGTFEVEHEAYVGAIVTIKPDPNEGFHVDQVIVESNGQAIEVEESNGQYTFVMPDGNVQVTTTFKIVESGTGVEVVLGVITALLILSIGFVIAIVLRRRRSVKV